MNTVPGACTEMREGLSFVTVTVTPPAGAGADRVTSNSAESPTGIRVVPESAKRMLGLGNTAVALNTAGVKPETAAVVVWSIALLPRVHVFCASPEPSVVVVVNWSVPWRAVHVTVSPGTGFPPASRTSTTRGCASVESASAVWSSPDTTRIVSAAPTVPAAVKVSGKSPNDDAVNVLVPTVGPRTQLPTSASPNVSVSTVSAPAVPPPDATENATGTPATTAPEVSRTSTPGAVVTAVFTVAVSPSP